MVESKAKRYSNLSGIFFALALLCRIINTVKAHDTFSWTGILALILLALFAVSTFLRNKEIAIIAAAINAFQSLYYVIFIFYFDAYSFLAFLADLSLAAVIMLTMGNNRFVRSIWYISGVLELMVCFSWVAPLDWFFKPYMWDYIGEQITSYFPNLMPVIAKMFGYFCIGLWCKYEVKWATEKSTITVAASSGQVRNASPIIGDADKLKTYKSLLDSGAITQEEFDEKKRQILGL